MKKISEIIASLDEASLPNRMRVALSKMILENIKSDDPIELAIMSIRDKPLSGLQQHAVKEIWLRVKSLPIGPASSRARLVATAIPSEQRLDGCDAEYILKWAEDLGLSKECVELAFDQITNAA